MSQDLCILADKNKRATFLKKNPIPQQTKEIAYNKTGRGAQASVRNPVVRLLGDNVNKKPNHQRIGQNQDE